MANSTKSPRHKELVDGKVIDDKAPLTKVEDEVIKNLSDEEVKTLVKIRKDLDAKMGDMQDEAGFAEIEQPGTNVVL